MMAAKLKCSDINKKNIKKKTELFSCRKPSDEETLQLNIWIEMNI